MTNDIKIRILSDKKLMMVYRINVVCFDTVIDSLKVYSIYTRVEDNVLRLKTPKERFFNKISMKFSVKKNDIKYQYVDVIDLIIENESYRVPRFLTEIKIDDVKLICKLRDSKLAKLLE